MSEPKPIASLSGGLLARKGEAHPAIRRAPVPMIGVAPRDQQARLMLSFARQKPELAIAEDAPPVEAALPRKARAAFTLRLDSDRHLRLRLASAVANRSAQQIVTEALDAFLDSQPGLDTLVAEARKITADRLKSSS
ncbi:hypothetical protein ASE00_03560 [Sphingomonas sp. Root710]|uniref:hypothetical protein n=1 Tax=Sphingomonas sp. Root710 TaxID=1736594 RepID=UPI000713DD56|nr:hypothetical protein [Sphingomonas sp. Root710]KRB85851.1 hypothetical protein ASE00_03560 [Sphingomonas sp. Root710]